MTESDWLSCRDPALMLQWLRDSGNAGDRQLRLFACACCRRLWDLLTAEACEAVEISEGYADGLVSLEELREEWEGLSLAEWESEYWESLLPAGGDEKTAPEWRALEAVRAATQVAEQHTDYLWEAEAAARAASQAAAALGEDQERHGQAALLRDVFGNPFRPASKLEPSWLTGKILTVAQSAYEAPKLPEGTLDPPHVAALADALEEAGCTDVEIVAHLRSPGPHVRGCFAVDWVLGKA